MNGGAARGTCREFGVAHARIEGAPRFLDQPQAHDVLQQADRSRDAAFVGQVAFASGLAQQRVRELDAEQ